MRIVQNAAKKEMKKAKIIINKTGVSVSDQTVPSTLATSSLFLDNRILKPLPEGVLSWQNK